MQSEIPAFFLARQAVIPFVLSLLSILTLPSISEAGLVSFLGRDDQAFLTAQTFSKFESKHTEVEASEFGFTDDFAEVRATAEVQYPDLSDPISFTTVSQSTFYYNSGPDSGFRSTPSLTSSFEHGFSILQFDHADVAIPLENVSEYQATNIEYNISGFFQSFFEDSSLSISIGTFGAVVGPGAFDFQGVLPGITDGTINNHLLRVEANVSEFDTDSLTNFQELTATTDFRSSFILVAVPEPSSLLLVAGGIASLAVIRKRRSPLERTEVEDFTSFDD